jgi:methyl-accepting chemotaxis protein
MTMFSSWTVGRRVITGFALAGLTLAVIAGVAYINITYLIKNDKAVEHSNRVRLDLTNLLSMLKDAETGQRGYVLTGKDSYLAPHTAAVAELQGIKAELLGLTDDNPKLQRQLNTLKPLIDGKLAELQSTIDLRRTQGFDAALAVVLNDSGKTFMDQIRATIAEADSDAVELLKQRAEEAQSSADATTAIIVIGGAVGTLLVIAIGLLITTSLSNQVGSAVTHVQSSSAELQAAANQQATGAKEQATAMTEIGTTISELLATSRQIAESARRVSQNAEQTAGSARLGHGTVDLTNDSIMAIKRQTDQVVSHMLELGKKSQEIGSVLDIVSELAEQTNILAINATIEAAGAGENGRRFAIVADEIRKLADRVAGSAKEIRGLIDDVRSAVNTTVMATETGSKAVDAGARQFGEVAQSFKQIAGLVTTTTEAAREIELSTKQQATAVEQVNIAISSAAQASAEMETSAGQTLRTAGQLAQLSRELTRIIRSDTAA